MEYSCLDADWSCFEDALFVVYCHVGLPFTHIGLHKPSYIGIYIVEAYTLHDTGVQYNVGSHLVVCSGC